MKFRAGIPFALTIVLLVLGLAEQTDAQNRSQPQVDNRAEIQLLKALLDEVSQLRQAMQKNTVGQYRSHLLLDRLRRSQYQIDTFESDLIELRDQIDELTANGRYDDDTDEIKDYETSINGTSDAKERADLVQEQSRLKRVLERKKKTDGDQLERLRDRERQLKSKIQIEQSTLADLSYQLNLLEGEMDREIARAEKQEAAKQETAKPEAVKPEAAKPEPVKTDVPKP